MAKAVEPEVKTPVRFELDPRLYPGWPDDLERVAEAMVLDIQRAAALQKGKPKESAG